MAPPTGKSEIRKMTLADITPAQAAALQGQYEAEYLASKNSTTPSTSTHARCHTLLILSRSRVIKEYMAGNPKALKASLTLIPSSDIHYAASFPSNPTQKP